VARNRLLRSRIFRLALIYLCLFSAAILAVIGVIYWSATESVTRQIDATIDAEIRGLAEQYNQRGLGGLVEAIRGRAAAAGPTRGLYLLADHRFTALAGNLSRWPDEQPDAQGWLTFRLEFPEAEGGGVNFGRARVFDLGGGQHLLVGHDVRERTRIAGLVRESLIWGLAIAIALSAAGGVLMSRSLLRQIDRINTTSHEIMAGDLSQRVPLSGRGDEFDDLAANLNAMLVRIEQLYVAMKQVTDNIAHDLRSPLGRLRSRLEVTLMERPGELGYRVAIEQSIAEADALLETFNALLGIAQAESGAPRQRFAPIELAEVLRDAVELYEPLAEERGLTLNLDLDLDGPATTSGDRNLVFQAIANLIDNAIKFSRPGGHIEVALRRDKAEIRVSIADRGPGIPEASRSRVLEPFFRLESSRSTPGSGLGLSLVAAVARLHDGRLRLEDNHPGLRACLILPAKPDSGGPGRPVAGGPAKRLEAPDSAPKVPDSGRPEAGQDG